MAEQARKFGGRVAELRRERHWKQRDLVAAMAELGDQALNTNQLSRYENGGAMPSEQRQEWFAEALETDVADLVAGPLDERTPRSIPAPFSTGEPSSTAAEIRELRAELRSVRTALLSEIGKVRTSQEALQRTLQRGGHSQGEQGS